MNTEQKAKAYDEAVKKLKIMHDDWAATQNRAAKEVEEIFPELKESEDERIKKAIIEYFESCNIKHLDWIAWVEKQGEPKPSGNIQVSKKLYEHIRNTCACIDDALSSKTLADITDYLKMANKDAISAFDMIEAKHERGS